MSEIPKSHPRYKSLIFREKISDAMKNGLVHETGLIAHGRGEAFDYLLSEKTLPFADEAEKIAVAALLGAENPVISVNGNVVALSSKDILELSILISAKVEINLFHRTKKRMKKLEKELKQQEEHIIYGIKADARIPGLEHDRGLCDKEGIYSSDVILVPLEDGDRCKALKDMGKKVITIDLNPLSRTARTADITIVDNIIRAIPNMIKWAKILKKEDKDKLNEIVKNFDNKKNLSDTCKFMSKRLNQLY